MTIGERGKLHKKWLKYFFLKWSKVGKKREEIEFKLKKKFRRENERGKRELRLVYCFYECGCE